MFALFLMAAAAVPDRLKPLLTPDDYPNWALESDVSAAALVDILIDPQGKVVRCATVTTYGPEKLAREVCGSVMRKRLTPAVTATGQPVHLALRTLLKFFLPDSLQGRRVAALKQPSDVILSVTKLPDGATTARVGLDLLVDENGSVINCGPLTDGSDTTLAAAACKARDQLGISKMVGKDGKAIRYMTSRKIEFIAKPQNQSPPPDNSAASPR